MSFGFLKGNKMVSDIIKEYEKHITSISEKYKKIIEEHRDYILDMKNDLLLLWSMVSDKKPHEEIKQMIQKIIKERFEFYPKQVQKDQERKK